MYFYPSMINSKTNIKPLKTHCLLAWTTFQETGLTYKFQKILRFFKSYWQSCNNQFVYTHWI